MHSNIIHTASPHIQFIYGVVSAAAASSTRFARNQMDPTREVAFGRREKLKTHLSIDIMSVVFAAPFQLGICVVRLNDDAGAAAGNCDAARVCCWIVWARANVQPNRTRSCRSKHCKPKIMCVENLMHSHGVERHGRESTKPINNISKKPITITIIFSHALAWNARCTTSKYSNALKQ